MNNKGKYRGGGGGGFFGNCSTFKKNPSPGNTLKMLHERAIRPFALIFL